MFNNELNMSFYAGGERRGSAKHKTKNTELSQYPPPPPRGNHLAAYQASQGTVSRSLSTGQGPG